MAGVESENYQVAFHGHVFFFLHGVMVPKQAVAAQPAEGRQLYQFRWGRSNAGPAPSQAQHSKFDGADPADPESRRAFAPAGTH